MQVGDYYTVQVKELSEEWLACGDYGAVKRELQLVTSLGRCGEVDIYKIVRKTRQIITPM